MIFHVPRLIMEISKIFTLEAGDLILTGTPEGVGPIKALRLFLGKRTKKQQSGTGDYFCVCSWILLPLLRDCCNTPL